jgi:hypothetical protein
MALGWSVLVLVFALLVISANLIIWNNIMAGNSNDDTPSWLSKILPGINILAIIGAAVAFGGLLWQVSGLETQLTEFRTEVRNEFSALNNEVYRNDNSLKLRTTRIEDNLNRIGQRVIREDFEREIQRLNTEIARLNSRIAELETQLREFGR